MNGSLLTLGLMSLWTYAARRPHGVLNQPQDPRFTVSDSPLTYRTPGPHARLALVDDTAPAPGPEETYFVPTRRKSTRGRVEALPGAESGVVAFCDYHLLPDGAVYIDFYTTRRDLRRQGYGQEVISELYRRFADAPYIDWGLVASDEALRMMQGMKAKVSTPRTYGKLW